MCEPVDVVGSAFGFGKVLVELTTISPFFGYAAFAKGAVGKRHQVAQSEQRDRLHPARPGRITVFGRPLFMEPDKKFPKAIALDAAFPCEESRGAEQRFTDESVDRAVDDQGEQRVDIVIEHASDNFGQVFSDGIAEQGVDLIEGPAQQAQQRLVGFPVTRTAQDVKPAEQQQAFIVGQFPAIRGPQQNGAQFRRGFLDSQPCTFRRRRSGSFRSVATA